MPQIFYAAPPESEPCLVSKNGVDQHASILERRGDEVYVHYADTDKRLDEWVPEEHVRLVEPDAGPSNTNGHSDAGTHDVVVSASSMNGSGARKRKRSASVDVLEDADGGASEAGTGGAGAGLSSGLVKMSEEEYDIEHHKQITARRNFDRVIFGRWQIKTWYFSPYPLTETEGDEHHPHPYSLSHAHAHAHGHAHRSATPSSISAPSHRGSSAPRASSRPAVSASVSATSTRVNAGAVHSISSGPRPTATPASASTSAGAARIPGVARSSIRSHGRTSDLLAGGLGRNHAASLWVCDRCFKYMAEGGSWELHVRKCTIRHPPGRKVYQRGAHIIWEVDGAKEKLYCQNLSLFGKLFIDIKTLFFDCDNFLFYILTDADSQRDHVLGFFSKEKISYDEYNLACIVVLPPYQKKGYGMLLIEFSYELSRRAGKQGTPERPLSDLGLRSYLTYWTATLVRYFRHLLSVLPPGTDHVVAHGGFKSPALVLGSETQTQDGESVSGGDAENSNQDISLNGSVVNGRTKKRKSTKGWDGEGARMGAGRKEWGHEEDDSLYNSLRTLETTANSDGSATTHASVQCTLAEIARVTGLRVEDVAFALNECGLLMRRQREVVQKADDNVPEEMRDEEDVEGAEPREEIEECVVISREMVETVARARGVKKMCMDLAHVLL